MTLTVDPYDPQFLPSSDTPLPDMQLSVPRRRSVAPSSTSRCMLNPPRRMSDVFHMDVRDPKGNLMLYYSGNVIARQGGGVKSSLWRPMI